MATTNLTGTFTNSAFVINSLNYVASGGATRENIIITTGGAIRTNGSAGASSVITLEDCNILIDEIASDYNTATATLSYGGHSSSQNSASGLDFINTQLILRTTSGSRRHYFLRHLKNSKFIDNGGRMFIVIALNAQLENVLFKGCSGVQCVGGVAYALDVLMDACRLEVSAAGTIHLSGLRAQNVGAFGAFGLTGGPGVTNYGYLWNNDASIDKTKLLLVNVSNGTTGNYITIGHSASWQFQDRDTGAAIEGVKVDYYDDINDIKNYTGTLAKRASYTTNADGKLVGVYDTRTRTTGVSQVRDTMFFVSERCNSANGGPNIASGGIFYTLVSASKRLVVKSYAHVPLAAYSETSSYSQNAQIGKINTSFAGTAFERFALTLDTDIVASKSTALAYTSLLTPTQFLERSRAAWVDNDNYPLLYLTSDKSGIDLGSYNLIIDPTAASAYAVSGNTITIKSSQFTGNITTSGTITLNNGATVLGTYTDTAGLRYTLPWEVAGAIPGSRLQIYNASTSQEIANQSVSGTSASGTYTNAQAAIGAAIRLRLTQQSGVTASLPFEATVPATSAGVSFLASQAADPIYNANSIDGSLVTTLTADYPNVQIDISDGDGIADARELYAFQVHQSTTASGIDKWFGAITAIDLVNYRVNTSVVDLRLQNIGSNPLVISGARIYRDDNTSILSASQGDKPMTLDAGNLIQYIAPQIDGAINANTKISKVAANTALIPSLL